MLRCRFLRRILSPRNRDMPEGVVQELTEQALVFYKRFEEARLYGFTNAQARRFADSTRDIGELRKLRDAGCPVELATRILR
jgi:hypothetical protein